MLREVIKLGDILSIEKDAEAKEASFLTGAMGKYYLNRLLESPSPGIAFQRLNSMISKVPKVLALKKLLPSLIAQSREDATAGAVNPRKGFGGDTDFSYDQEILT